MAVDRTPRILVVDDELRNAKLLEALLSTQGYEVVTAADGEAALQRIADQAIDLVLLDVMMPGLDGFEVTQRLRGHERTRLIPIVLITALQETEDRIKGIEAGCDDFISKPFDQHEVLARVKTLLTLSYYRSLLDEKEKFDYVINHIDDGIVVLDPQLQITRLNRRAAALLSLEPPPRTPDVIAHMQTAFRIHYDGDLRQDLGRQSLTLDLERPETDTTKALILSIRSSVVRDPLGTLSSVVLTVHDATEERTEERLKQNFLSLISHKLRTPMAVIASNASVLQEGVVGPLNELQQQALDAITRKAQGLQGLIENLLTFTSLSRQAFDRAKDPLILQDVLRKVLERLVNRVTEKQIDWSLDGPADHLTTHVPRMYFELIMDNLLDNAVKFNDQGVVKITVALAPRADQVEVVVSDNGRGIPPEEREKVFGAFYQVEKYFTGQVEGAGLGLALVKHLVAAYGGTVRVNSTLGQGTTVAFTVPM